MKKSGFQKQTVAGDTYDLAGLPKLIYLSAYLSCVLKCQNSVQVTHLTHTGREETEK